MYLESILNFDMKKQELCVLIWFSVTWTDESLSWNASLYPIDSIFLPPRLLWHPDLSILNSFVARDKFLKLKLLMQVFQDGKVQWLPGEVMPLECPVDIRYYPFDTQTCSVKLGPWSRNAIFLNGTSCRAVSIVRDHGDWEILNPTCKYVMPYEDQSFWTFEYSFQLRRKGIVYAVNVLLPLLLVSALNSVVFALPVQCGEKMSVSLTSFLALAVFMTLIQDSLPSTSDTVCYLSVYLAFQMLLSALAIIVSAAVVVACHHRKETRGAAGGDNAESKARQADARARAATDRAGAFTCDTGKHVSEAHAENGVPASEESDVGWQRLGLLMDKVCFPVFIALNILSFVIFCISVAI
nr:hypothetical protein BaRGS_003832 [Batillaria attramentaria]